jgi:hypothetical protein
MPGPWSNRFSDGRIYDRGRAEEAYPLGREEYALGQMAPGLVGRRAALGPGHGDSIAGRVPGVDLSPRGSGSPADQDQPPDRSGAGARAQGRQEVLAPAG